MNPDSQLPADTTRETIPRHVLDRFESEWRQMRESAPPLSKASGNEDGKR